jgi:predicted dinucleotide-binding enzyme
MGDPKMKIAFIGIGKVGSALANGLAEKDHEVLIAAHDLNSDSVKAALAKNPALKATGVQEAVSEADVVFLATPFAANEEALKSAGSLAGKTLVDCTNPIWPSLTHGLKSEISGGEHVQNLVLEANVVKAFNIYGYENFVDANYPGYGDLRPAMLIAGNDKDAKSTVSALCEQLGWAPVDTGDISMSLHLEHMTLLWVKMARVQGRGTDFVWAKLTR